MSATLMDSGYKRIAEYSSGGVGPQEIAWLPGTEMHVIANGGIETHPESGRSKLNLATIKPNLSYVTYWGKVLEQVELDPSMHQNSIRHLAVSKDGLVAFGMQWQGDNAAAPPLLGLHRIGGKSKIAEMPEISLRSLKGYVGSVAISETGNRVATSSPRGGKVQIYHTATTRSKALMEFGPMALNLSISQIRTQLM